MDTRHLLAAVTVARHGSFTAAADELFMAQSTVTRQVAALERQLGLQLFVRHSRSVELTPVGARFMPDAQHVLDVLTQAVAVARGGAASPDAGRTCLAPREIDLRVHADLDVPQA